MSQLDLVIIINNLGILVKGTDYGKRNEAVLKAIKRFELELEETKKVADKPNELIGAEEIREIRVVEITL